LEELSDLVVGYKIFTCESTGELWMRYEHIDRALARIKNTGKPVIFHCEDPATNEAAPKDGSYADSRPLESELKSIETVLGITRGSGVPVHFTHITSGLSVGMLQDETCDATLHHTYFSKDAENTYLKMNPPLRDEESRLSLMRALAAGKVNALATDHAPHTREEKMKGMCGVPTLECYGSFVSWLMSQQKVDPQQIAKLTSYEPARILGIPDVGRIAEGYVANLTAIATNLEYEVKPPYQTKCGWSCFEGKTFPGRVMATIYRGNVVY
jgi:dihydroorotase